MEIAEQKKNLWMTRLRFFFGALLLAILISMLVKAGQFSELLGRLQFGQIVVVIGLTTIYMLIGGINIGVLLGSGVTKTIEVTRAYLLSWCVSLVMPSKSGDLTIIYYLNQEGFSKEEAASVFTLDKLVSLVVYAAVPIMFLDSGTVLYDVSVMIVVLNAVVVAGALLSTVLVSKMTSPYKIILVAAKVSAGCTELLVRRPFAVAANAAITFGRVFLVALIFWYLLRSFDVSVSLSLVASLQILANYAVLLPVSIGGIGTVEALAVALFAASGVSPGPVLVSYLTIRIVFALLAIIFWSGFKRKVSVNAEQKCLDQRSS